MKVDNLSIGNSTQVERTQLTLDADDINLDSIGSDSV